MITYSIKTIPSFKSVITIESSKWNYFAIGELTRPTHVSGIQPDEVCIKAKRKTYRAKNKSRKISLTWFAIQLAFEHFARDRNGR